MTGQPRPRVESLPDTAATEGLGARLARLLLPGDLVLLEGPLGSAPPGANPTSWPVLGTTVKVPPDTRLRHVYVITLSIRNATL